MYLGIVNFFALSKTRAQERYSHLGTALSDALKRSAEVEGIVLQSSGWKCQNSEVKFGITLLPVLS